MVPVMASMMAVMPMAVVAMVAAMMSVVAVIPVEPTIRPMMMVVVMMMAIAVPATIKPRAVIIAAVRHAAAIAVEMPAWPAEPVGLDDIARGGRLGRGRQR
jgi:hypothetical protein